MSVELFPLEGINFPCESYIGLEGDLYESLCRAAHSIFTSHNLLHFISTLLKEACPYEYASQPKGQEEKHLKTKLSHILSIDLYHWIRATGLKRSVRSQTRLRAKNRTNRVRMRSRITRFVLKVVSWI